MDDFYITVQAQAGASQIITMAGPGTFGLMATSGKISKVDASGSTLMINRMEPAGHIDII